MAKLANAGKTQPSIGAVMSEACEVCRVVRDEAGKLDAPSKESEGVSTHALAAMALG